MNKLTSVVTCLCTYIFTVSAEDITFNGNETIPGHDYLTFSMRTDVDVVEITKVSIDEDRLSPRGGSREITLIIPGEVQGTQVNISKGAFMDLSSNRVELNIQFKMIEGGLNPMCVQLPKGCSQMFYHSPSITKIDFSEASLSQVENADNMFALCRNLKNIKFGDSFRPCEINNMSYMFWNCKSLLSLDLQNVDTSKVTNMDGMFWDCRSLTSLDLSTFNTSNLTTMTMMFTDCERLQTLNLKGFNTNNVTGMTALFYGCSSLKNLDLSSFNTSNVTNMEAMFAECASLKNLNLSSFNMSSVTDMSFMFKGCRSLSHIPNPVLQNAQHRRHISLSRLPNPVLQNTHRRGHMLDGGISLSHLQNLVLPNTQHRRHMFDGRRGLH